MRRRSRQLTATRVWTALMVDASTAAHTLGTFRERSTSLRLADSMTRGELYSSGTTQHGHHPLHKVVRAIRDKYRGVRAPSQEADKTQSVCEK